MDSWANEPHASEHKEWGGLLFCDAHILSGSQTKESTQKGFSLSYEILDRKFLFAPLYNSSVAFGFSKGSSTLNIEKMKVCASESFVVLFLIYQGLHGDLYVCICCMYVCQSEFTVLLFNLVLLHLLLLLTYHFSLFYQRS